MNNVHFEKKFQKTGLASQRRYPNEALIQFLAKNYFHFSPEKRKKVKILELGCGSGANLWMIAREGFSSYGIDIASTGIKLCRRILKSWGVKARVCVEDMKKIRFGDNFFDAIVDVVSMQHLNLKEHEMAYREVIRCLKKGGLFFQWHLGAGSTPFREGGGVKIDKLTVDNITDPSMPLYDAGATCFLTARKASGLLKSAGFKNIHTEVFSRTYKDRKQFVEYLAITAQK